MLHDWAEAVTHNDVKRARNALASGIMLKMDKLDPKELEMYNKVSKNAECKLTVLRKNADTYELGYVLHLAKSRTDLANLKVLGSTKSPINLKPGDVVQASLKSLTPMLIEGLYGCTATGIKILYKIKDVPNSSKELCKIAETNGSFDCSDAMKKTIEKFNLTKPTRWRREAKFFKADTEKRLVYCVVLRPSGDEGESIERDTDGQWYDRDDVELACHAFMIKGQKQNSLSLIKLNHKIKLSDENVLVESYINLTDNPEYGILVGDWIVVYFVGDDSDWLKWKEGKYRGVSIEGPGFVTPDAPDLKPQDVAY